MNLQALELTESTYEKIADQLAEHEFVILDKFLSLREVEGLIEGFDKHRQEEAFHRAGIGNAHLFQVDQQIRGDYINWIDPEAALPVAKEFLNRIDEMMQWLNRFLFLSLRDFECHYAIYPPGTFYEKHLDQFKNTINRKISFACYLNRTWERGDGGQLRLYRGGQTLDIEPLAGRLVLFRSDTVPHEVLTTQKDRYSITGWLRDQPIDLPFFQIQ